MRTPSADATSKTMKTVEEAELSIISHIAFERSDALPVSTFLRCHVRRCDTTGARYDTVLFHAGRRAKIIRQFCAWSAGSVYTQFVSVVNR